MHPYNLPPTSQHTERTVMLDPTGRPVNLGGVTETSYLTDSGPWTEVTRTLTQTADGVLLLQPGARELYRCGACGAQPLMHANTCTACGRATCTPCSTIVDLLLVCRACAEVPLWRQVLQVLGRVIGWLRP